MKYQGKDGRSIIIRGALEQDLSSMISNFKAIADEKIYLFTEAVTEERQNRMAQSINEKKNLIAVAEVDSKVVGEIALTSWGDSTKSEHVRNIAMMIIDGYREIGVGSALMDYAIKWSSEQPGIEKLVLGVFSTNKRAKKLYEKFGFQIDGTQEKMFKINGEYVDEITMSRFV